MFKEGLDMNRIILITVCLLAITSITSGSLYWSKQKEETVNKAKVTLKNVQAAERSQSTKADLPEQTKGEDKTSLSEIKDYYISLFNELEVQETSKADQLLVQAKADQVSGKFSKAEVTTKYQALSQKLEQNADQTFDLLYESVHADLSKNGHSKSEAKEFKTSYHAKKKERIDRIMTKLNKM